MRKRSDVMNDPLFRTLAKPSKEMLKLDLSSILQKRRNAWEREQRLKRSGGFTITVGKYKMADDPDDEDVDLPPENRRSRRFRDAKTGRHIQSLDYTEPERWVLRSGSTSDPGRWARTRRHQKPWADALPGHRRREGQRPASGRRRTAADDAALYDLNADEDASATHDKAWWSKEAHALRAAQKLARKRKELAERRRKSLSLQRRGSTRFSPEKGMSASERAKERFALLKARRHELSPLLMAKKKAAEARKRRALEKERRRKERELKRERDREARERHAMNNAEWDAYRLGWWGMYNPGSWKTVRVFISSTFNDMHGERDVLTRTVFPALNERLRPRRVRVVPVDLRWGLTAEDTSDAGLGALEHCLIEIDNSRPFIVVLAGERYGWIPPGYRVSDKPEFKWVSEFEPNHSITAMEIFYGFLNHLFRPVHAFLYERDPSFMDAIEPDDPAGKIFSFDYSGDAAHVVRQRRDELRAAMRAHHYCESNTYECQYGGLDAEGKPHVTGLGDFEKMITEDLYEHICFEFAPPPAAPDTLAYERVYHRNFLEGRANLFVGRQDCLDTLNMHANGDPTHPSVPMVVVGAPGSGKTSITTVFAHRFAHTHPEDVHTTHAVQASPLSSDLRELLLRLCGELVKECDLDPKELPRGDFQQVKEGFAFILELAGAAALETGRRVILTLDSVDQLNPFYGAHTMDWFPTVVPPGVRAVISLTPESECFEYMMRRDPRPAQLDVPDLTQDERQKLVARQLSEYRKKLTKVQMDLLLAKAESHRPLFLITCCEELRLQAQYGMGGSGVDVMIRKLPHELDKLLDIVLDRVERDLTTWANSSHITVEHISSGLADAVDEEPDADASAAALAGAGAPATPDLKRVLAAKTIGGAQMAALTIPEGEEEEEEESGVDTPTQSPMAPGTPGTPGTPDTAGGTPHRKRRRRMRSGSQSDTVGGVLVHDVLTLLVCSRHGLKEKELLEMLAPANRAQLPSLVWARLYRSLEVYLRPVGEGDEGLLSFFHPQMVRAVSRRYLAEGEGQRRRIFVRLALYFRALADPTGDGRWLGENDRAYEDLVYYQLRARQLKELKQVLGNLKFIEARITGGDSGMEHLLRDYQEAQDQIKAAKYSQIKRQLASVGSSRAAELLWLREFQVFVGANAGMLVEYPRMVFQLAANQPSNSGPATAATGLLEREIEFLNSRYKRDSSRRGAGGIAGGGGLAAARRRSTAHRGSIAEAEETMAAMATQKRWGRRHSSVVTLNTFRSAASAGSSAEADAEVALVPRRWLSWANKPMANRIVADYTGFPSQITCVDLSPADDAIVAAGLADSQVIIVDAGTGELVRELNVGGHAATVTCCAFSQDGVRLATGGTDSRVVVWDAATGAAMCQIMAHERTVSDVLWLQSSKDARGSTRLLVTASTDSSIKLWEEQGTRRRSSAATGAANVSYEKVWEKDFLASPIRSLAFSEGCAILAGGREDGVVQCWDARAVNLGLLPLKDLPAHTMSRRQAVTAMTMSPDGDMLVTGGADKKIKAWVREGEGEDTSWREHGMRGGGHSDRVTSLRYSKDGARVVSAGEDQKTLVWDMHSHAEIIQLPGHTEEVSGAVFDSTCERVISASRDSTIKVWDVGGENDIPTPGLVKRAGAAAGSSLRRSGKGHLNTTGAGNIVPDSDEGDASSGGEAAGGKSSKKKKKQDKGGAGGRRRSVVTRMRRMSGAMEGVLEPRATPGTHAEAVLCACFSPNGKWAVTGAADLEVKVWDLLTAKEVYVCLGHAAPITAVTFSDDNRLFFSGDGEGAILIWDGVDFNHNLTVFAAAAPVRSLTSVLLTKPTRSGASSGLIVFAGAEDGTISAWKATSGEKWESQPMHLHSGAVTSIVYLPGDPSGEQPLSSRGVDVHTGEPLSEAACVVHPEDVINPNDSLRVAQVLEYQTKKEQAAFAKKQAARAKFAAAKAKIRYGQAPSKPKRSGGGRRRSKSPGSAQAGPPPLAPQPVWHNPDRVTAGERPEPRTDCLMSASADGATVVWDIGTMDSIAQALNDDLEEPRLAVLSRDGSRVLFGERELAQPARTGPAARLKELVALSMHPAGKVRSHSKTVRVKAWRAKKIADEHTARWERRRERLARRRKRADRKARLEEKAPTGGGLAGVVGMVTAAASGAGAGGDAATSTSGNGLPAGSDEESSSSSSSSDDDATELSLEAALAAASLSTQQLRDDQTRTATAADFSTDGSLTAVGCDDHIISVYNSATPEAGALVNFAAYGPVTALAMGPGMLPWPIREELKHERSKAVHDRESRRRWAMVKAKMAQSLPEKMKAMAKAAKIEKEAIDIPEDGGVYAGGGDGRVGVLIAGDTTGTVFILNVMDAHRVAEAHRIKERREEEAAVKAKEEADAAAAEAEESEDGDGGGGDGSAAAGKSRGKGLLGKLLGAAAKRAKAGSPKAAADAAAEAEAARAKAAEEARLADEARVTKLPADGVSSVEFPNGRTAATVTLPRVMNPGDHKDRLLSEDILTRVGVDIENLPLAHIADRDAKLLLGSFGMDDSMTLGSLRRQGKLTISFPQRKTTGAEADGKDGKAEGNGVAAEGKGDDGSGVADVGATVATDASAGTHTGAADSSESAAIAPTALAVAAVPPDADGSVAGAATSGGEAVALAGGDAVHEQLSVAAALAPGSVHDSATDGDTDDEEMTDEQREAHRDQLFQDTVARPHALVCVFGGAGGLRELLVPKLRALFTKGVAGAAVASGGMIMTGATKSGVMDMIGSSMRFAEAHMFRLMGCCPRGLALMPGEENSGDGDDRCELEPHHTHFFFAPSSDWGGETTSMFTMTAVLSEHVPCVAVVANGGGITKKEVVHVVRQGSPVIVIAGSGRLADVIAAEVRAGAGKAGWDPTSIADEVVREILDKGRCYVYDLGAGPEGLQALIMDLLEGERRDIRRRALERGIASRGATA